MPERAALAKIAAARESGAEIVLSGSGIDDCIGDALAYAEEEGLAFVHPFDDPAVIAGQGTIGLELLDEVPDLSRVLVPVGGGGLAAGVASAIKESRDGVEVSASSRTVRWPTGSPSSNRARSRDHCSSACSTTS